MSEHIQTSNPDVLYKLGRIEALVEAANAKIDTFILDSKQIDENHETRISNLEKKNVRYATLAAVAGGGFGLFSEFIMRFLGHHG